MKTAMRAAPGTTAGLAPVGYERSPLSSFGRLDAECSLPASVVAARPGGGAPDSGTLTADILSLGSGRRRRAP